VVADQEVERRRRGMSEMPAATDLTPLHWFRITDPESEVPDHPPGVDVRALLPDSAKFATLEEKLLADGIPVRKVRYLVEQDTVSTLTHSGRLSTTSEE
jgi:hypothetical protein